ncbi:MAG: hypothetical protein AB7H90_03400 [Alphaproteobacteria bacterium]
MPINQRNKGRAGEQEIVRIFKQEGYEEAERGWQSRGGGEDNADVNGIPGVHVEVKRTERFEPYNWLAQAQRDAGQDRLPVVLHRRNRQPWMAIMPLEFFLKLMKERT